MDRVQKIIAHAGIASRRNAELLIQEGRVTMNGKVIKIGQCADPLKDKIMVDGQQIQTEKHVYIILNKPLKVVTTLEDNQGRETVRELVDVPERVFPVGRLDRNATGLVLLTNDGDLANRMMHPRYETTKTYVATLSSPVHPQLITRLEKGVLVEERLVAVHNPKKIATNRVEITIHEGRKHIVKKLFVKLGTHVDGLERSRLGPLELGNLKPGDWRILRPEEVKELKIALKMTK